MLHDHSEPTAAADLARRWPEFAPPERRARLSKLIDRIDLLRETLTIGIRPGRLAAVLRSENRPRDLNHTPVADAHTILSTGRRPAPPTLGGSRFEHETGWHRG